MKINNSYFEKNETQRNRLYRSLSFFIWFIISNYYDMRSKLCIKKQKDINKDYSVSICGIFKNEAPYLKEWIEYHRIIGIEHFFLYNNNSTDEFRSVLDGYIEDGLVTLIEWPHNHQQIEAYTDCAKKFSQKSKWIGFIDIDEFIVLNNCNKIYDFLKQYNTKTGSIKIYWKVFGSSGKLLRDIRKPVIEDFIECQNKYSLFAKCFYNTNFELDIKPKRKKSLHHDLWWIYHKQEYPPKNVFGKTSIGSYNYANNTIFPIQINHYSIKSYNEYTEKKRKGDVYYAHNPHNDKTFYDCDKKCNSVDFSAYKYLKELKNSLEK